MAVERIIGVDFGTSTSVIRVKRYENGEPVGDAFETKEVIFGDSGAVVPTLVLKSDNDGSITYYGYEAQQKKRRFTNYHSFKVDLESTNAAKREHARKLTGEFLTYIAEQYRLQRDGGHLGSLDDTERTIISYPVKWGAETKQFMLDAAEKAGFPNVTGMDEAQAAIHAVTTQSEDYLKRHGLLRSGVPANILLIDMGAGTTDLVLCRHTPSVDSKTEILSTWPKSGKVLFGGKEVDALLKNFFLDKMDEADAQQVFKRVGTDKFKSWKELSVSPTLRDHKSVTDFEALDNCVELMEIDMDEYCLNRSALEDCLKDYLKQLPILINGCIYDAGIKGSDVDLVVVTGGHSQWYFVQEMLSGKMTQYGNIDLPRIKENSKRLIPVSRPQETVALGLVYSPMHNAVAVPEPDPGPDQDSVIDSVFVPIDNPQIKDLVVKKRETEKKQRRTSDKKQKPTKNMKQGHQAGTRKVILGVVAVLLAFMVVDQLGSRFASKNQDVEKAEWTASMHGDMTQTESSAMPERDSLTTESGVIPSQETEPTVTLPPALETVETPDLTEELGKGELIVTEPLEIGVLSPVQPERKVDEKTVRDEPWASNVLKRGFNVGDLAFEWEDFTGKRWRSSADHVIFVSNLSGMQKASRGPWDVSEAQDGSVMAWYSRIHPNGKDDCAFNCSSLLYIGAEGGVNASLACTGLFAEQKYIKAIAFNDSFYTEGAVSMEKMFYNCSSLEMLDLSCFDTSSVTNMSNMLYGLNIDCKLTFDQATFDTSNVTEYDNFMNYGTEIVDGIPWTWLFEN